jgi:hypothetical protein
MAALAPPASAQPRFELLTRDKIAAVSGLQIITIRDNQLAACYTIFVLESPAPTPPPSLEPTIAAPSAEELEKADVLRRVREAAANRDRQLTALRSRIDPSVRSRDPIRDQNNAIAYEAARRQIDDEYERAIAPLLPGSYPWAAPTLLGRTGGWDDVSEAMRRGLSNPDPTTSRTFSDPGGLNAQLELLFQRLLEAPRLAASGPTACSQGAGEKR